RKVGREYGTVTGRPRRVGWFDVVAARYSQGITATDELALMLLDVLSGLADLRICTAYETAKGRVSVFPSDPTVLEKCTPVYETLPGWIGDISIIRRRTDLPKNAQAYIARLEELMGKPVSIISVGPDREQSIMA